MCNNCLLNLLLQCLQAQSSHCRDINFFSCLWHPANIHEHLLFYRSNLNTSEYLLYFFTVKNHITFKTSNNCIALGIGIIPSTYVSSRSALLHTLIMSLDIVDSEIKRSFRVFSTFSLWAGWSGWLLSWTCTIASCKYHSMVYKPYSFPSKYYGNRTHGPYARVKLHNALRNRNFSMIYVQLTISVAYVYTHNILQAHFSPCF